MENQSDKSQEATPHKLEEARKKGQVGKSAEFVSAVSLCVLVLGFCITLPHLIHIFIAQTRLWFKNTNEMARSPGLLVSQLNHFAGAVVELIGVILALGMIAAVVASILHVGPIFSLFPLKLDFSKLNPVNGIKKIFSRRGLVEILKLCLKIALFTIAFFFVWGSIKNRILYPSTMSANIVFENWKVALHLFLGAAVAIYILFACFDLWYSKREFSRKMRMSTRDVKEEYRRREGDPEIKSKRKKNLINLIRNIGGASKLKDADVIITNPTHFAVALKYRSSSMAFPIVIAKGRGLLARYIILRAARYGIPVFRRPPLARKIFADSQVNSVIPLSEQKQVAEVYKEILKSPNHKVFS